MPDTTLLEVFPAPACDGGPIVIEHVSDEFTSLCPKTGHPDFGSVTLRYQPAPGGVCVELKSLKLYYQSFRSEGIFYEAVTSTIRDHLVELMKPTWLQIITDWKGRGGIRSLIRAEHGEVPPEWRGR
ncbi:MAG: NADPH-dependent 7-cyano-7-deazaguanine reductase QueF [Phycisphaeraceae bacterium]|nr:MAG: NADPH-dependent 7-cyano-7-deazaguanine reductase QueF [Phycisphaeraceae bacterium]